MNENAAFDASLVGKPIDLTNCDREPIHIPGSIQPHGCLLACDNAARRVVYRSANAAMMLNLPADPLGQSLTEVIGADHAHRLLNALAMSGQNPRPALVFGVLLNEQVLDVTIHRFQGPVAKILERFGDEHPHGRLVIDHQHGLALLGTG